MDPLSFLLAKADLTLSMILGYFQNPEIILVCVTVAAILSLAFIHKDY